MKPDWTERARARMQEIGVSQEMLAKALGCTRGAVGHYLAGRREPSLKSLGIIAETLGLDTKWMVFGDHAWNGVGESSNHYRDGAYSGGRYVPISGTTAGGRGEQRLGTLDLAECSGTYALQVEDVAWAPRVHDGELILLCTDRTPQPGDEVWVEYADGTTDLKLLVQLRDGKVVLDSVTGQRQRQTWRSSEIKSMHSLIALFRGRGGG